MNAFSKSFFVLVAMMVIGLKVRANFFENKGQWPEEVLFHSASPAGGVWICKERIIFDRFHPADVGKQGCAASGNERFRPRGHVFSLRWDGASFGGEVVREGETSFYLNYFFGNDPAKWASYVRGYQRVVLKNIWPGIDVRLHAGRGLLKYDFVVHPGADVNHIRWHYTGADEVVLRHNEIHILTSAGAFIETMPACWLQQDNTQTEISLHYTAMDEGFGFEKTTLPTDYTLIIDPELIAATYLGVTLQWDTTLFTFMPPLGFGPWTFATGHNSAFTASGDMFGTSSVGTLGFPFTEGAYTDQDGFTFGAAGWAKFNSNGSQLLFATAIGLDTTAPANNNQYTYIDPVDLLVDESTQSFLVSITTTSLVSGCTQCLPATLPPLASLSPPPQPKLHLSRFNWDSSELLSARFVGDVSSVGNGLMNISYRISKSEIATDGNYVLVCSTANDNFPVTAGSFNTQPSAFGGTRGAIVKLTPDLESVIWGTYFADTGTMAIDLKVLPDGNLLVGGRAVEGTSLSVTTPSGYLQTEFGSGINALVSILSADGTQLLHGTILTFPEQPGNPNTFSPSFEVARFVDFDPDGNIYLCGACPTNSSQIPCSDGVYCNEGGSNFIAKFSPDLSQLLFVSRIGCPDGRTVTPTAFMVDNCGYIYLSGFSGGNTVFDPAPPLTPDALQSQGGFYLAVYEPDMTGLHYASLFGGNHIDAGGSRFDKKGVVYQTVCDQNPLITNTYFQTTPNAWSTSFAQGMTVELAMFKIDFQSPATTAIMTAEVLPPTNGSCYPVQVQTHNYSSEGQYTWLANGSVVVPDSAGVISLFDGGAVELQLAVYNAESCNQADTAKVTLQIPVYPALQASWTVDEADPCAQGGTAVSAQWTGQNATSLTWDSWAGTSTGEDFAAAVTEAGDYTFSLTATDSVCGYVETLSYAFGYNPLLFAATGAATDSCALPVVFAGQFTGAGTDQVVWQWGAESVEGVDFEQTFAEQGIYTVSVTATNEQCNQTESQSWTFTAWGTMEASVAVPTETVFCLGNAVTLSGQTNTGTAQWTTPEGIQPSTFTFQPPSEGTYDLTFTATDPAACNGSFSQTVTLTFVQPPVAAFTLINESVPCADNAEVGLTFAGSASSLVWDTGDGFSFSESSFSHTYTQSGTYNITLTAFNPPCAPATAEEQVQIWVGAAAGSADFNAVNIITPNADGINDCLRFFHSSTLASDFLSYDLRVFNRWGNLVFSSSNFDEAWCGDGAEVGTYYFLLRYDLVCDEAETVEKTGWVTVGR